MPFSKERQKISFSYPRWSTIGEQKLLERKKEFSSFDVLLSEQSSCYKYIWFDILQKKNLDKDKQKTI